MRYLFHGRKPQTGEPVEGRVTAPTAEAARDVLRDEGIVADALEPEPAAPDAAPLTERRLAYVLQRALGDAGFGVSFDLVTGCYQGRSLSLLDRDRLYRRVMELLGDAAAGDPGDDRDRQDARRQVARLAEQLLQHRLDPGSERSARSPALEARIDRITEALGSIERQMASMSRALRWGGHNQARHPAEGQATGDAMPNAILIEVFESNLELMRGLEETALLPAAEET